MSLTHQDDHAPAPPHPLLLCSPPGTYKASDDATSCTDCPAGTYNPYEGKHGIASCLCCGDNTQNAAGSACTPTAAWFSKRFVADAGSGGQQTLVQ